MLRCISNDGFSIYTVKELPGNFALAHKPGISVGQGNTEEKMRRIIAESSYRGTIGVINEESDPESKAGLRMNMD